MVFGQARWREEENGGLHETILTASSDLSTRHNEEPELQGKTEITSRDHPGVLYRKSSTTTVWEDDDVRTDMFKMEVIEEASGKIVRVKDVAWSAKLFWEDNWEEKLEKQGLKIAGISEGKIQRWYLLKKA